MNSNPRLTKKLIINDWKHKLQSQCHREALLLLGATFEDSRSICDDLDSIYDLITLPSVAKLPVFETKGTSNSQFYSVLMNALYELRGEKLLLFFSDHEYAGIFEFEVSIIVEHLEGFLNLLSRFSVTLRFNQIGSMSFDFTPTTEFDPGYQVMVSGDKLVAMLYPIMREIIQNIYDWTPPESLDLK